MDAGAASGAGSAGLVSVLGTSASASGAGSVDSPEGSPAAVA